MSENTTSQLAAIALREAVMAQSPIKAKDSRDSKISIAGAIAGLVFSIALASTPFIVIFSN
jgi:hypothetical protein